MNTFSLEQNQIEQVREWKKTHECTITNEGAIGGKYTYEFTPTGLGVATVVKCACGAEINVTDYDNW